MAEDEEARARSTLLEMQRRLSQGPHIVLGIAELATAAQVRAAFLEMTKQFHPARFGRMSSDVQRMSNEVFLGIKSAHESMMRALGVPVKPMSRASQSGSMKAIEAEGSNQTRAPTRAAGTGAPPPPPAPAPVARPARPRDDATMRGIGAPPVARRLTPAFGIPAQRPGTPPQTPPAAPAARQGSPPPRPASPPGTDPINPGTVRHAGAPAFDERKTLAEALALLHDHQWNSARNVLHTLASRVPQSKQYRALLCYARGRETQHAGRPEDAALEFQRALQLDPDLASAKQALAEVQRRR